MSSINLIVSLSSIFLFFVVGGNVNLSVIIFETSVLSVLIC